MTVITEYIQAALRRAKYEILEDEQTFVGTIPGFQGVWSNADTLEACREELREVLESWLLFSISRGHEIPEVDGISLEVKPVL